MKYIIKAQTLNKQDVAKALNMASLAYDKINIMLDDYAKMLTEELTKRQKEK